MFLGWRGSQTPVREVWNLGQVQPWHAEPAALRFWELHLCGCQPVRSFHQPHHCAQSCRSVPQFFFFFIVNQRGSTLRSKLWVSFFHVFFLFFSIVFKNANVFFFSRVDYCCIECLSKILVGQLSFCLWGDMWHDWAWSCLWIPIRLCFFSAATAFIDSDGCSKYLFLEG